VTSEWTSAVTANVGMLRPPAQGTPPASTMSPIAPRDYMGLRSEASTGSQGGLARRIAIL